MEFKDTMTPETKRLILKRISSIEKELETLKQLIETSEHSSLYIDDADITDANIIGAEPEQNSTEQLLRQLFSIMAKNRLREEQQKAVTPLIHSSISEHSPALDSFFRFSFKTFQDRWQEYLEAPQESSSFQIERQKENHLGELMEVKLYLVSPHRSPSPITFKQDPKHGLDWKIQSLSL